MTALNDPDGGDVLDFDSPDGESKSVEWSPYPSKIVSHLVTVHQDIAEGFSTAFSFGHVG